MRYAACANCRRRASAGSWERRWSLDIEQRSDEPLRFAVGLGSIGSGDLVASPQGEDGLLKHRGAGIGQGPVRQDAFDLNALLRIEGPRLEQIQVLPQAGNRRHPIESDHPAFGECVVRSEELVPAADAQQHRPIRDRRLQLGATGEKVLRDNLLDAIGPSSDHDHARMGWEALAQRHAGDLHRETPPFRSARQGQEVATVRVGVQQVGVEMREDQVRRHGNPRAGGRGDRR